MGEEAARADEALRRAAGGARVALVSQQATRASTGWRRARSARAAELAEDERPVVAVVPGVTAALAAGALLGAPLADDFAALSLSDLQVAWEVVERRLTRRRGRRPRARALQPALAERGRGSSTACSSCCASTARPTRRSRSSTDAARPGERVERATLATLDPEAVTMCALLVVAGESGRARGPSLVAERGAGVPA